MQKIYIDVTNVLQVKFLTGIQRVVSNVVLEMEKYDTVQCVFLNYNNDLDTFELLDHQKFIAFLKGDQQAKEYIITDRSIKVEDMESGEVFFDIDSVWNSKYKRSKLLPDLKKKGVRLAVFIHDIIPVTHPQFSTIDTIIPFMDYIGAYLQYADLLLTSTQSTLDEIYGLMDKLNLDRVPGYVTWLGSDFNNATGANANPLPEEVVRVTKDKYILCVGTIEPRKNHALMLEAFEKGLFEKGINLVFAGKMGWNIGSFKQQMEKSRYYNKQFFHFEGLDDYAINYLYEHAYMMAFPTFIEGFGLPMVEAFERKVPVIASDCKVLREVGKDYCDFFDPYNPQAVVEVVESYVMDDAKYKGLKDKLDTFEPFSWSQTTEKMVEAITTLKCGVHEVRTDVRQMVMITKEIDVLKGTLEAVDTLMPFVEEVLICCSDALSIEALHVYKGRLTVKVIPDSELLDSQDTHKENLKYQLMKHPLVQDLIILSEDNFRPVQQIDKSVYITENAYVGYYIYEDITKWISSTEEEILNARAFLEQHKYPMRLYHAQMPQIIDKKLYLEMMDAHDDIKTMCIDDMTAYFNYVKYHYPDAVKPEVYVTMAWPQKASDWRIETVPTEILFERYSANLYDQEELLFRTRIKKYRENITQYSFWQKSFDLYKGRYRAQYDEEPLFGVSVEAQDIHIHLPEMLEIPQNGFVRIPWFFESDTQEAVFIEYFIKDAEEIVGQGTKLRIESVDGMFELPVKGVREGKYNFVIKVSMGEIEAENGTETVIIGI